MRNLSTAMLCLAFVLTLVVQLGAQTHSNYFVQEVVEGKYSQIKAVQNSTEVILRPDRIEIFNSETEDRSSYFIYESSNAVAPQGRGLIVSSTEKISNADMAEVLGQEYMKVHKYGSVVYQNLYDGADLEVSYTQKGQLQFKLVNHKGSYAPFALKAWDTRDLKDVTDGISVAGLLMRSDNTEISLKEGKITVDNSRRAASQDVSFTLDFE